MKRSSINRTPIQEPSSKGAPADDIIGTGLNDNLRGNKGTDVIRGLKGDDTVNGGQGHDTLHGGRVLTSYLVAAMLIDFVAVVAMTRSEGDQGVMLCMQVAVMTCCGEVAERTS